MCIYRERVRGRTPILTGDEINKISQVDVENAVTHEVLEMDSRDCTGLQAFGAARERGGLHQSGMQKYFARARFSLILLLLLFQILNPMPISFIFTFYLLISSSLFGQSMLTAI